MLLRHPGLLGSSARAPRQILVPGDCSQSRKPVGSQTGQSCEHGRVSPPFSGTPHDGRQASGTSVPVCSQQGVSENWTMVVAVVYISGPHAAGFAPPLAHACGPFCWPRLNRNGCSLPGVALLLPGAGWNRYLGARKLFDRRGPCAESAAPSTVGARATWHMHGCLVARPGSGWAQVCPDPALGGAAGAPSACSQLRTLACWQPPLRRLVGAVRACRRRAGRA